MIRGPVWLGCGLCLLASCGETSGVGDPCVPEDEVNADFAGFSLGEVSVESGSVQCESRLCIVNHFQGRVGCAQGQEEGQGSCRTANGDDVTSAVKAWDLDRPASSTVYCSCRCDGPTTGARYCECPSGYSCRKLIDNLGLGQDELAGSYCIKDGTEFKPTQEGGPTCRTDPTDPVCR
ncbi:MAG: hypothetical protein R3B13_29655 [Polyangiaceae bacterium]